MGKIDMDIKTKSITKSKTTRPAYITLTDQKAISAWKYLGGKKPARFKNKKGEIVNVDIKTMVQDYISHIGATVDMQMSSGDLIEISEDK